MGSKFTLHIVSFFSYVLVQALILQNVVLFDKAFCLAYVAFLLCLPVDIGILMGLLLGFITGLSVDIFYDTLGMHAFACVFIMFIRSYWLNMITPQGGYDVGSLPTINLNGWQWMLGYIFPIVFVHHLVLFYIEASSFGLFWFTLSKVILSTFFTTGVIFIGQYLFYRSRRS
ncbi:MAG: Rod shape-determining protein MreD [Fulvivirga sp.]|uniref:Rod shape-determining protein MreD n=1 Tax=Fulvivirga sp. TaxID=1931237 RepID=UPI0032F02AB2